MPSPETTDYTSPDQSVEEVLRHLPTLNRFDLFMHLTGATVCIVITSYVILRVLTIHTTVSMLLMIGGIVMGIIIGLGYFVIVSWIISCTLGSMIRWGWLKFVRLGRSKRALINRYALARYAAHHATAETCMEHVARRSNDALLARGVVLIAQAEVLQQLTGILIASFSMATPLAALLI